MCVVCALQEWQPESVQLLLAAGADVHQTWEGVPVLHEPVMYLGDEVKVRTPQPNE